MFQLKGKTAFLRSEEKGARKRRNLLFALPSSLFPPRINKKMDLKNNISRITLPAG
jgi:hypothetical protein